MKINKKVKEGLIALGLSSTLVLTGTYLTAPYEGEVRATYADTGGVLTACYGHTGKDVKVGQIYTEEQCIKMLADDLIKHEKEVDRLVKVDYKSPFMKAALIDFTFNVGGGSLANSTLLKKINNKEYDAACDQLTRWIYANYNGKKQVLKGLVTRRSQEYKWCMGEVSQDIKLDYQDILEKVKKRDSLDK